MGVVLEGTPRPVSWGLVVRRCVLVAVCFASLALCALLACSAEEADRRGGEVGSGGGSDGAGVGAAEDGGFASPRDFQEGGTASEDGRSLKIQRAVLSSAGSRDIIHVSVRFSGSKIWPSCSLVDGPSRSVARRSIGRLHPPRAEGWTHRLWSENLWDERESSWSDRRDTEAVLLDDGTVLLAFPEDPSRGNGATDPRRTPHFARCTGGEGRQVLEDEAHVTGTPEARS